MVTITVTSRDGAVARVAAAPGTTLKDAILTAGFPDLVGLCGGYASCGTCQVVLPADAYAALPPPDDTEAGLLEGSLYATPTSRLSCQIRLDERLEGLHCTLTPEE